MVSGGARARSGPPPDPNALRENGEWVTLPNETTVRGTPGWPFARCTESEREYWVFLWSLPQGVMWARQRQEHEVALYCRRFVEAQAPGTPTNLSTLVRQMGDSLGLTTPGLRANRWKIAPPAVEQAPAVVSSGPSTRDRFSVVKDVS
jgi:hypothetical protein